MIKGEETSYAQRTMFQDIIIRQPQLSELSIHCENVHDRIARAPAHDWLELCKQDVLDDDLAKDTVGVNDDDFDILSRVVLEGIHFGYRGRDEKPNQSRSVDSKGWILRRPGDKRRT